MKFRTKSGICEMGHFAEFNVANARWPLDDPRMAGFSDNVDKINRIAERSPGFVWRLVDEDDPAAPRFAEEDNVIFTLSVWESVEALRQFTWNTAHKQFRLRRDEWFKPMSEAYLAIWPIAEGHRPDGMEALTHLGLLRAHGPSEHVFGTEALRADA